MYKQTNVAKVCLFWGTQWQATYFQTINPFESPSPGGFEATYLREQSEMDSGRSNYSRYMAFALTEVYTSLKTHFAFWRNLLRQTIWKARVSYELKGFRVCLLLMNATWLNLFNKYMLCKWSDDKSTLQEVSGQLTAVSSKLKGFILMSKRTPITQSSSNKLACALGWCLWRPGTWSWFLS